MARESSNLPLALRQTLAFWLCCVVVPLSYPRKSTPRAARGRRPGRRLDGCPEDLSKMHQSRLVHCLAVKLSSSSYENTAGAKQS